MPSPVGRQIAENIDVFDFTLDDVEMATIAGLDTGSSLFFDHRDPEAVARLSSFRIHH